MLAPKSAPTTQLTRHGETLSHPRRTSIAQAFVFPAWHEVQGFGIPACSVLTGEINRNVWAAT